MSDRFTLKRRDLLLGASAFLAGCVAPTRTAETTANDLSARPLNASLRTAMTVPPNPFIDRILAGIAATPGRELSSVVGVAIRNGRVVYEGATGFAQLEPRTPATPDSLYRIASISKMFVAMAAVKLADEGALDLDRDVSAYLGFPFRNPNFANNAISLRMLLSHTSSLRDGGGYNFPESVHLREVLVPGGARYGEGAMWAKNFAPGQFFNYCNFAFGITATVMERATGERFDRLMERVLFAPLGVTASFDPASFDADSLKRVATLYRKRTEIGGREVWNTDGPWVAQVDDFTRDAPKPRASNAYVIGTNGSVFGPQGGLRISARDLTRTMLMLMARGTLDGRAVMSERAVALLLNEQWRYNATALGGKGNRAEDDEGEGGLFNAWALGPQKFLDVSNGRRGDRMIERGGFTGFGHLGNAYGLTSAFVFNPDTRDGMIFLVGGTASDPEKNKGMYSAFYRYEEEIFGALSRAMMTK